jgi:hypothetical protein
VVPVIIPPRIIFLILNLNLPSAIRYVNNISKNEDIGKDSTTKGKARLVAQKA